MTHSSYSYPADWHLVGCQCSCLVRADNRGAAQRLHWRQAADDGILPGHPPGAQCQAGSDDCWEAWEKTQRADVGDVKAFLARTYPGKLYCLFCFFSVRYWAPFSIRAVGFSVPCSRAHLRLFSVSGGHFVSPPKWHAYISVLALNKKYTSNCKNTGNTHL